MIICPNCRRQTTVPFCQYCGYNFAQKRGGYQQPYQQPYPRPLPRKSKAAITMAIITLVMLLIAGAFNWWSISIDWEQHNDWGDDYIYEVKLDFTLEEMEYDYAQDSDGDFDSYDGDTDLSSDMEDVSDITGLLMTLGIVMMILVIISMVILTWIVHTRNRVMAAYTRTLKNLTFLFSLLALIFVLIAPIYYFVAWPDAFEDDMDGNIPFLYSIDTEIYDGTFMGSESFDDEGDFGGDYKGDASWGPGIGWYLAFVCVVFLLITLILVKLGGNEAMRMAPVPQYMPQQPYGGYGQLQQGQYQPPPQYPPPQLPQQPPPYP